eukprot:GFYU01000615.1.p1 GENE.GFYU01000615.1~~GFYU01000615.1.p1  ORF type:complete len:269 (-),score=16.53 GFYU01000615.1:67-873(-)
MADARGLRMFELLYGQWTEDSIEAGGLFCIILLLRMGQIATGLMALGQTSLGPAGLNTTAFIGIIILPMVTTVSWHVQFLYGVLTLAIRVASFVDLAQSPDSFGSEQWLKLTFFALVEMGTCTVITTGLLISIHGVSREVLLQRRCFLHLTLWLPVISLLTGSLIAAVVAWPLEKLSPLGETGPAVVAAQPPRRLDPSLYPSHFRRAEQQHEQQHEEECVVCMDEQACVRVVPCGHWVACRTCAAKLKRDSCPLCRGTVERLVTVSLV